MHTAIHQAAQPHLATLTTAETAIPKLRAAYLDSKANHLPGTQTLKRMLAQAEQCEHLARRALDELVAVDQAYRAAVVRRMVDASLAELLEDTRLAYEQLWQLSMDGLRQYVAASGGHRKPAPWERKQVAA